MPEPAIPKTVVFRSPVDPWPGLPRSISVVFDLDGQAKELSVAYPLEGDKVRHRTYGCVEFETFPHPETVPDGGHSLWIRLHTDYMGSAGGDRRGWRGLLHHVYVLAEITHIRHWRRPRPRARTPGTDPHDAA